MSTSPIRLTVYRLNNVESLASVRYTSYGEDGIVDGVNVVDYGYGEKDTLDSDASCALKMGMDVSMITSEDINTFPKLIKLTKR